MLGALADAMLTLAVVMPGTDATATRLPSAANRVSADARLCAGGRSPGLGLARHCSIEHVHVHAGEPRRRSQEYGTSLPMSRLVRRAGERRRRERAAANDGPSPYMDGAMGDPAGAPGIVVEGERRPLTVVCCALTAAGPGLERRGRRDEARALLSEISGWPARHAAMPEIAEARALLRAL